VGHSQGIVAVQAIGDGAWKVLDEGQTLPERCLVRTAAGDPCTVHLGQAALYVAPETRLELDSPGRHITLQSGAAFLSCKEAATWRINGQAMELAAGRTVGLGVSTGKAAVADLSAEQRKQFNAWSQPPRPAQGMGQLVIQDVQSQSPVRLNVARYHVRMVLQPPVALVEIDQSFYNPYPRQEALKLRSSW
jgi:hypothetical protein